MVNKTNVLIFFSQLGIFSSDFFVRITFFYYWSDLFDSPKFQVWKKSGPQTTKIDRFNFLFVWGWFGLIVQKQKSMRSIPRLCSSFFPSSSSMLIHAKFVLLILLRFGSVRWWFSGFSFISNKEREKKKLKLYNRIIIIIVIIWHKEPSLGNIVFEKINSQLFLFEKLLIIDSMYHLLVLTKYCIFFLYNVRWLIN